MNRTKIEYGTHAWNPVTGCSYGCPWGCWAEGIVSRFPWLHDGGTVMRCAMTKQEAEDWESRPAPTSFRTPLLHPDRLDEPLLQKKPARVLVSFMGDLFGPEIPEKFVFNVFGRMHSATQHFFFVLTKRAREMQEFISAYRSKWLGVGFERAWPDEYRHVHLGVTVTTQAEADERIPLLLQTPAARRWVSIEPMLGPINLREMACQDDWHIDALDTPDPSCRLHFVVVGSIDRPSAEWPAPKREWIELIREQCAAAGVPLWEKNNLRTRGPVRDRRLVQELP